jgi:hypothetical protein
MVRVHGNVLDTERQLGEVVVFAPFMQRVDDYEFEVLDCLLAEASDSRLEEVDGGHAYEGVVAPRRAEDAAYRGHLIPRA